MVRKATSLAAASFAALAASCTTASAPVVPLRTDVAGQAGCISLTAQDIGAAALDKRWVEAADGLPAFCEVTASLAPAAGSNIGVVYRLPMGWNGKVLGLGGGGWAGNVTLLAARDGLAKGYATLQTDGGHPGTNPWDNSWASNPESVTDFSHRAIHEMTVAGKQLVRAYYGTGHSRAYFQGCSTGGRMALMEAQRYPKDYDAISAGAPVYTLQTQTSAILRNQTFAADNGAGGFSAADLTLVQDAALAACDGDDGVKDGVIGNPRACSWQPRTLQCTGAKTASCLAPAQVTALQAIYTGLRASDGSWAMLPMMRGGEAAWSMYVGTDGSGKDVTGGGGMVTLKPVIVGDRPVNFSAFTDGDYLAMRSSGFAATYEAKNPDLSAFFGRGGKLLLWHGESDPGPSPIATTDYAKAVMAQNPLAPEQFRFALLPGVEHCRGGPGADEVDLIGALDRWVASDTPPDRLIGTKADGSRTRVHCAWPNTAHFAGSGDSNDPANWSCRPPA